MRKLGSEGEILPSASSLVPLIAVSTWRSEVAGKCSVENTKAVQSIPGTILYGIDT